MPRRGWSAMDIPSGWVQVLRGPRPKSETWPVASSGRKQPTSKQEPIRGRWRQAAPRSNVRAPDPDAALEHARSKVSSLEAALTAMGSHQGPEVDALRSALSNAKQAAQERPLKVQLAQTDAFVERSRQRIKKLEEERDAEVELKQRHPEVSHRIIGELEGNPTTPNLRALADTTRTLTGVHGFEPPGWRALAEGLRPQTRDPEEHEPGIVSGGWQHEAAIRVEWHTRSVFLSSMSASEQALQVREPIENDDDRPAMKKGDVPPPVPERVANPRIRKDQATTITHKHGLISAEMSSRNLSKTGTNVDNYNVPSYQCSILFNNMDVPSTGRVNSGRQRTWTIQSPKVKSSM